MDHGIRGKGFVQGHLDSDSVPSALRKLQNEIASVVPLMGDDSRTLLWERLAQLIKGKRMSCSGSRERALSVRPWLQPPFCNLRAITHDEQGLMPKSPELSYCVWR